MTKIKKILLLCVFSMLCAPNVENEAPLAESVEIRSLSGDLLAQLELKTPFLDSFPERETKPIPEEQGRQLFAILQRQGRLWTNRFNTPYVCA
jgi:hypothetical protein